MSDSGTAQASTEAAHGAFDRMVDAGAGELRRMAADLAVLRERMDGLSREIDTALGRLSWHGAASDAFVRHARQRVREIHGVADGLDGLSRAVERLADAH